jgi:hypothetical protein
VGTGDGDYTVDFTATNFEGVELDAGQVAGHATAGAPIVPLNFTVREDYSPPPLWTAGAVISSSGGSTDFAVVKDNATQTVHATGGAFTDLMFSLQGNVIALKDDGAGGSTRVTIPRGLMGGEFTVRVDGDTVPFTSIADGNGVTVVFDRPSGAEFITIEGESVGSAPATPPGDNTPLIVVGAIMAAAAAIAVFYLWRRRAKPAITPPT